MSDRPRRFWQIHFSTAVVLMVLGGLFMWINFSSQHQTIFAYREPQTNSIEVRRLNMMGWPVSTYYSVEPLPSLQDEEVIRTLFFHGYVNYRGERINQIEWYRFVSGYRNYEVPLVLFVNIGFAVTTLVAVALVAEYLIRRRSKP